MTNQDYTQDGLTLSNMCPMCIEQEQLCVDCVDQKDARLTDKAYALVDEGLSTEGYALYRTDDAPSASDWVSSETITKEQTWTTKMTEIWDADNPFKLIQLAVEFIDKDDPWLIRKEFANPVTQLIDGGTHDELWELDDERQRAREVQCPWCNILTPKLYNDCQTCDRTLESNVR